MSVYVKCPACIGVGYFGLGTDCKSCFGTGERTLESLPKSHKEYFVSNGLTYNKEAN
jgi:DnaJ-class molecular chaperone